MKMKEIGIITLPVSEPDVGKASLVPLSNLIKIITSFSRVNLVSGKIGYDFFKDQDNLTSYLVKTKTYQSRFLNIICFILNQFSLAYPILKFRKIDCWIFFIGGELFLIPMIVSKILRKKVIIIFSGSATETLEASNDYLSIISNYLSNINCFLADKIVVYSESLIKKWKLDGFKEKISIARHNIIDLDNFNIKQYYNSRSNTIGFVGRFSHEKGILNLLSSREKIINHFPDVNFLIIGDGPLKMNIEDSNSLINEKTELIGWVDHEKLSEYLNRMKILIIPSYTEGLPNVMLESMACGTPVLANSVGSIPDIIIDGKNGFILRNNNPDCISTSVINLLKIDLELISENAHESIVNDFDYNKSFQEWKKIIFSVLE